MLGFKRSATSRKRPLGLISDEEGKLAIKQILAIQEEDLLTADKVTPLPYVGLGRPCTRPGPDLKFVGRKTVAYLLVDWQKGCDEYLITGPKGVGKSTDFRALAVILTKWFASEKGDGPREKLVFLYAERLVSGFLSAVKEALLFAFMVDEMTNYGDWEETQASVRGISSVESAVTFVKKRPEKFYFFVDGGECLDPKDYFGKKAVDRNQVSTDLKELLGTASRVWWCTSPKAVIALPESTTESFLYVDRGFSEDEYRQYASASFLEMIKECRLTSIAYLTGFVPLFLEVLRACCELVAGQRLDAEIEDILSRKDDTVRVRTAKASSLHLTNEQIALTLEEDDDWNSVVVEFKQHKELKVVERKARKIELQGECSTDAAMAALDPTYVLNAATGVYCSGYIKMIYTREIRAKEDALKPHADGAWMVYARHLMRGKELHWSMLGHLCEDLLADVIHKKGLVIGEVQVLGRHLTLEQFDSIPSNTVEELLKLKADSGYYFKPVASNFPHVDAVVVWMDKHGKLFIIGLQFTVNIDSHRHSANGFMNLLWLRRWFPDVPHGEAELHYAFIGCSSQEGYQRSVVAPNIRTPRSGTPGSGTVGYTLHYQPFDDKAFPGLQNDDYKVLHEITSRRTWKTSYADVHADGLGLLALTRDELEKLARQKFGIADPSRSKFKNKALLINKMLEIRPGLDTGLDFD